MQRTWFYADSVLMLAEQWMHVSPPLCWCWLNNECMGTVNTCCSISVWMLAEQRMHVAPPLCWCWLSSERMLLHLWWCWLNSECMLLHLCWCWLKGEWMHVAPPLCAGGSQPDSLPGTGHEWKATQRSPWVADLDHFQGENENGNNNDDAVLSFCHRWDYKCILMCLCKMGMVWFSLQVHFEVPL